MTLRLGSKNIETKPLGKRLRRSFFRDEDGSFIIFGLALFIAMLFVGGLGVDVMRYEVHRNKVQQTLDRAILAAASLDQELDPKAVVIDYFTKAGLGHIISEDDITVVSDSYSRTVQADLKLRMDTTFLRMGNYYSLNFPAAGGAEESTSITEISLVVDVSGSMGNRSASGNSKIYELREAAKKFANITMCNPSDPNSSNNCTVEPGVVSISLVPYSEQVLLGDDIADQFNLTNEHSESTCVTFDTDDFGTTGITPTQLLKRTGYFDPSGNARNSPRESNMPCQTNSWREIVAFEHDVNALHSEINALQASGNTSIDLGMKWGTAFLDPAAQDAVSGLIAGGDVDAAFEGRPYSYATRGLSKVIVLMSDGANTSQDYLHNAYRDGPSPVYISNDYGYVSILYSDNDTPENPDDDTYYWESQDVYEDHPYGTETRRECDYEWVSTSYYNGYWSYVCEDVPEDSGATQLTYPQLWATFTTRWYEQWRWLGTPDSSYGTSAKNARLNNICTAAKNAGITVFTVGFEVDDAQDSVMSNCASDASYYFDVDGLDISAAFSAIAREISKLRLVY